MDDSFEQIKQRMGIPTVNRRATIGSDAIYRAFKEEVHEPRSVLYPSCATDATPATVFDNVTFVDIDKECIDALVSEGHTAHHTDTRSYAPGQEHDLLILLNPATPAAWSTPHLAIGGYVLANNYHGTAHELNETDEFDLAATISDEGNVSWDLEGLFAKIDMKKMARTQPSRYAHLKKLRNGFIKTESLMSVSDPFKGVTSKDPEDDKWNAFFAVAGTPFQRGADRYVFRKTAT